MTSCTARAVIVLAFLLSSSAAFACPDGQYQEPVTRACLPKASIGNVPTDVSKGVDAILRGRAPGPAQLGTLPNGKRVCFPWC